MSSPNLYTPKRTKNVLRLSNSFNVPPTPMLQKIGYGTGVNVYHYQRSAINGVENSPWALKKVSKKYADGDFAERLKKEAELLKSFSHPNIVGFRGFTNSEDGREVLAMEECTISLGDMIEMRADEDEGPFPAEDIAKVALDTAKALHYLHKEKNIIHGDIKSHNLLIKGDFDAVKVCDFGVCLAMDPISGESQVEDYVGTLIWSAPETLADGPVTAAADIFSLGLVIWEMIALAPPHVYDLSESMGSLSDVSFNSSIMEQNLGKRPPLPESPLGPEYTEILEVFNLCTETDYRLRPSAEQIISMLS